MCAVLIRCLSIFILAFGLSAWADTWVLVSEDPNERVYVDTTSIRMEGDLVYSTRKADLISPANPYKLVYGADTAERWQEMVENCTDHTKKVLQIVLKTKTGETRLQSKPPSDLAFMPIRPESSDQSTHSFVCREAQHGSPKALLSHHVF